MGSSTQITDVIVPEVLAETIGGAFAGMDLLYGTGAALVNPTLQAGKSNVGESVKVPYFDTIGEAQDVPVGGALTPRTLTMSEEESPVEHCGIAVSVQQWAQIAAAGDPYAEAQRQIMIAIKRYLDKRLITKAMASLSSMTVDAYALGAKLNYDSGVDAKQKFGDEARTGDFALWGIHSKVEGDLLKTKDADGKPMLIDSVNGGLQRFMNVPVMVSDKLAPSSESPARYKSLLIQNGALAIWINENVSIKFDEDILSDDQIMAVHVYFVCHRYGRLPGKTKGGVAIVESY